MSYEHPDVVERLRCAVIWRCIVRNSDQVSTGKAWNRHTLRSVKPTSIEGGSVYNYANRAMAERKHTILHVPIDEENTEAGMWFLIERNFGSSG